MTSEAYVKSTVYDMSGGLLPAPADDGYNITLSAYTPTGPLGKTKVLSQKDFIDRFMLGSTILPTDHESAIFTYMLLANNPVYVNRACPASILEGISSTGNRYIFDSDYNLLDSYIKFGFDVQPVGTGYQIGPFRNNDLDTLVTSLVDKDSERANSYGIISSSDDKIVSRQPLTASSNIGIFDESVSDSQYYTLKFQNQDLSVGNYVSINGTTFEYLGEADTTSPTYPNAVKFVSKCKKASFMGLYVEGQTEALCHMNQLGFTLSKTGKTISLSSEIAGLSCSDNKVSITHNEYLPKLSSGALNKKYVMAFDNTKLSGDLSPNFGIKGAKIGDCYLVYDGTELYKVLTVNNLNLGVSTSIDTSADGYCVSTSKVEYKYTTKASSDLEAGEFCISSGVLYYLAAGEESASEVTISDAETSSDGKVETVGSITGLKVKAWDDYSVNEKDKDWLYFYLDNNGDICCYVGTIIKGLYKPTTSAVTPKAPDAPCFEIDVITGNGGSASHEIHRFYNSSDVVSPTANLDGIVINHAVSCSNVAEMLATVLSTTVDGTAVGENFELAAEGTITLYIPSNGVVSAVGPSFDLDLDDDNVYTYTYMVSNKSNNDANIKYTYLWAIIGNYFYYATDGSTTEFLPYASGKTAVDMTEGSHHKVNEVEFMNLLQLHVYKTQKLSIYKGSFISSDTELVFDGGAKADEATVTIEHEVRNQNPNEMFAVVQKFPSKSSVFKFSYNRDTDNENIIDLNLNYKNGLSTESWTMSFVAGVADGYGVDQWYTRVNSDNFKVVKLKGEGGQMLESYSSPAFGSNVALPEYNVQYMIDALQEVPNAEDGVHYDIVSDAGICDTTLAQAVNTLADELHAVYPASLPTETSNTAKIISYVGGANLHRQGNYEVRMLSAGDRIGVAGFSHVFPGSYKLILQLISAFRSGSMEFAPNFDLNHGTVSMSNPTENWKKPDRELLLDYGVETVKGGVSTAYYINDNTTAQSNKSYMSEEQNVRMTNTAIHIMEKYGRNFIGELNTVALRKRVQEGANYTLQGRLFNGKSYVPAQYKAVCDDTNNPKSVIEQNKLVIDLYASFTPSVKFVLVYHYIVPLSQVQ